MAYVDFLSSHLADQRQPSGEPHNVLLPHHHYLSPALMSQPMMAPTSMCPQCLMSFNPALSYTGGHCPNCAFKPFFPPPPPPVPAGEETQQFLSSNKRSTSSLSSSGSSSSSLTSPGADYTNDPFIMASMYNMVDDVLREEETSSRCHGCGHSCGPLSFCFDCQKHVCDSCYSSSHQHRKPSADRSHFPYKCYSSSPSPPKSKVTDTSLSNKDHCDKHIGKPILYFCKPCLAVLCYDCISDGGHQQHPHLTIEEALDRIKPATVDPSSLSAKVPGELSTLETSAEDVMAMTQSVLQKKEEAVKNVRKLFQQHYESVAKREKAVIAEIDAIARLRLESLAREKEEVEGTIVSIKDLTARIKESTDKRDSIRLVLSHHRLENELERVRTGGKKVRPMEDDSFVILPNLSNTQTALDTFCVLTTAPYPPLCTAAGEGLFHPRINRLATVVICTKDRSGEPCPKGGDPPLVTLRRATGNSAAIPVDVRDGCDGTYTVTYRPRIKGEYLLSITVRSHHIQGSPFKLTIEGGREYGRFGTVSCVFGSEGSGQGEFCRPWGICCDQKGHIIVGDRSNHRIQVFDSSGTFLHMFGTEGSQTGQFNRPAGVAVSREGNIVVADKDNHRIQVFKLDGTFIYTFGSKGGNDGQMIYPYDVAVNQVDGRIATTDTGNHRILIFSHDGILLGKFGYKGYLCGHFDSPRGIAINDEGHILVSDFNVHHILVIHPDGTTARILGSQGSGNGQFMRPQGISVDHMGNFVIADTRNNRIVIMHPCGQFVAKFGTGGSSQGHFDRPTNVTVLPDGRIAVIDFGNSRVQVF